MKHLDWRGAEGTVACCLYLD